MPAVDAALAAQLAPLVPAFAREVVAWQARAGRHGLPWQQPREPYRVWVSEIMLQQTQVSTVVAYFERFMARFPTVQSLASAPLDEVLALWAGLGYYSRARHLHRCAQVVVAEHGGAFPPSAQALVALPGIGASTAAAIAAFCFGERVAILDGNVKRVLSRVLAFDEDVAQPGPQRRLWALATALLPAEPADMPTYTQGLMDLGATLCTRSSPDCTACPVRAHCRAHAQGRQAALPVKRRAVRRGQRESWWLWLQAEDSVLLVRRPEAGIWAGLYVPLEFEAEAAWQATQELLPGAGVEPLPTVRHVLTHLDWTLHAARVRLEQREHAGELARREGARWVPAHQLPGHGLPAPFQRQWPLAP